MVDYDRLAGTGLVVRAPEPGDRFGPLGMGGKTMSLADFFRGRRVPGGQSGIKRRWCAIAGESCGS